MCTSPGIFFAAKESFGGPPYSDKLSIYVVNYPLMYFATRIAGEYGDVSFPAPPGVDPAYWTPDIPTIVAYQGADVILTNGAGYGKWISSVSLPQSKTVDTSAKFRDRYITSGMVVTHSHGPKAEHAHENVAFTTWLDFDLAAKQAGQVAEALVQRRPELKDEFMTNFAALEEDLLALDREIREITAERGIPLLASHPVYQYLARRYRLNLRSVHWEPGRVPTDDQWREINDIMKVHPAKWMIWEGEPERIVVKRLQTMGIGSVVFNPCSNVPPEGDYLTVMSQNVQNLKVIFQE